MIVDAWYMVTEYHLNLGPVDNLESVILLIREKNPQLKLTEKEEVMPDLKGKGWDGSKSNLAQRINQEKGLMSYVAQMC